MSLLVLSPRLFGAYFAVCNLLPLDDRCLLVLQCGQYVCEELVAIVLKHRTELIIYLLLNLLGRYYYYLTGPPFPISLVRVRLIVLLEPHILVEPGKCEGEFEGVADPGWLGVGKFFFVGESDKVVFELFDRQEALEAGIHVAIVRVVLQANYTL